MGKSLQASAKSRLILVQILSHGRNVRGNWESQEYLWRVDELAAKWKCLGLISIFWIKAWRRYVKMQINKLKIHWNQSKAVELFKSCLIWVKTLMLWLGKENIWKSFIWNWQWCFGWKLFDSLYKFRNIIKRLLKSRYSFQIRYRKTTKWKF